jgi:hypothetical protein
MQNAFWYVQTNGIESLAAYPDKSDVVSTAIVLINLVVQSYFVLEPDIFMFKFACENV